MATASRENQVQARLLRPPAELSRYFTSFYFMEFTGSGEPVVDYLHPEWANLRFFFGNSPDPEGRRDTRVGDTSFYAAGPSTKALRFTLQPPSRMWGLGLTPLGWEKYVGGEAAPLADAMVGGFGHPVYGQFSDLAMDLGAGPPDVDAEYQQIARYFIANADGPVADEARILALHAALVSPETSTVAQLVALTGTSQRTVARISHRVFGFAPKLLLRRQRFLRSLAHYLTEPEHKWIGAIDSQYTDQAHFVHDFKEFMGMTPRQYAAIDKPILGAFMRERAQIAGRPVQALDPPQDGAD